MIQLIPQLNILLACQPVDFRCGIDRLAARCRQELERDPMSGALFVFRNRRGTALKMLCFDGVGYWLVTRRYSQGKLRWWPHQATTPIHPIAAQQLAVLLYQGLPEQASFAHPWRALPAHSQATCAVTSLPLSSP
jgi:transposase